LPLSQIVDRLVQLRRALDDIADARAQFIHLLSWSRSANCGIISFVDGGKKGGGGGPRGATSALFATIYPVIGGQMPQLPQLA
jgi:hypothetical protein